MIIQPVSGSCYLYEYEKGLFYYQGALYVARQKWYKHQPVTPQCAGKRKALRCSDGETVVLDGGTAIQPMEAV